MSYHSFEDLVVWKRSCRLSVELYGLLKGCTDYGLRDQMTRAAVSIASNVAEGVERNTSKEFQRYLNIAKGSAAELRTQVYIASEIGIFTPDQKQELVVELKEISAMLQGLSKSLNKNR